MEKHNLKRCYVVAFMIFLSFGVNYTNTLSKSVLKIKNVNYVVGIAESLGVFKSKLEVLNNYSQVFVLVDENTSKYCLPIFKKTTVVNFTLIKIKSGEQHKNFTTLEFILNTMLKSNADRKALLINLGGGVICDMGGFAASVYKRGIDFINIPTTLLSMVDSSVGGKLGIDLSGLKNVVGVFNNPKAVFIAKEFLQTLPERQVKSGFAEMLKHGIICDKKYFNLLAKTGADKISVNDIVTSVQIKANIVKKDPLEKGERKLLNLGHTIGHAVESSQLKTDANTWLHGYCVVAGIVMENCIAASRGMLNKKDFEQIQSIILKNYKFKKINSNLFKEILAVAKNDKKNSKAKILCAMPSAIGVAEYDISVTEEEIVMSINYFNSIV